MQDLSRRSALTLAAATVLAGSAETALGQGSALNPTPANPLPKGVSRKAWGKREAMLPDYKNVQMAI